MIDPFKPAQHEGEQTAPSEALDAAVRLLARRDHSCQELRQKLRVRGFDADAIDAVIQECLRKSWLDDIRFAEGIVRQRFASGYGPLYIKAKIESKGVDRGVAEGAIRSAQYDWDASITQLAERWAPDSQDWHAWQKLSAKIARRGFAAESIRRIVAQVRDSR